MAVTRKPVDKFTWPLCMAGVLWVMVASLVAACGFTTTAAVLAGVALASILLSLVSAGIHTRRVRRYLATVCCVALLAVVGCKSHRFDEGSYSAHVADLLSRVDAIEREQANFKSGFVKQRYVDEKLERRIKQLEDAAIQPTEEELPLPQPPAKPCNCNEKSVVVEPKRRGNVWRPQSRLAPIVVGEQTEAKP